MADKGIIFAAPMVRALLDGRKTQTRRLCAWANNPNSPALTYIVACDEPGWFGDEEGEVQFKAPYAPGDRLYVRETCRAIERKSGIDQFQYRATLDWDDDDAETVPNEPNAGGWGDLSIYGRGTRGRKNFATCEDDLTFAGPWVPAIHAPRSTSRLWLAVTEVRVQRLQDISEADALAEGVPVALEGGVDDELYCQTCKGFGVHGGIGQGLGVIEVDCRDCDTAVQRYGHLWNSLHTAPGERWEDNPWIVAVSFDVHHGNIDEEPHHA